MSSTQLPSVALELIIAQKAKDLGIKLPSDWNSTAKKRRELIDAVEEMEQEQQNNSSYIDFVHDLTKSTGQRLINIADSSDIPRDKKIAEAFNDQIANVALQAAQKTMTQKFGPNFEDTCSMTHDILDKGLTIAGFPHDSENHKNEEMRKIILIMLELLASIFLIYMGIDPTLIALIVYTVEMSSNNNNRVIDDKKILNEIANGGRNFVEKLSPQVKDFGVTNQDVVDSINSLSDYQSSRISNIASQSSRRIPMIEKDKYMIHKEASTSLKSIINIICKDNQDLAKFCTKIFEAIEEKHKLSSLENRYESTPPHNSTLDKIANIIDNAYYFENVISEFQAISKSIKQTHADNIHYKAIIEQMHTYINERYKTPAHEFCIRAESAINKRDLSKFMNEIGFSKDVLQNLKNRSQVSNSPSMSLS